MSAIDNRALRQRHLHTTRNKSSNGASIIIATRERSDPQVPKRGLSAWREPLPSV